MDIIFVAAAIAGSGALAYFIFNKVKESRRIYNFHQEQ